MAKVKLNTYLEFAGEQYPITVIEKFVKDKVKERYPDAEVKEIGIYMQPETDHVYFTVNGEGTPEDCFGFDEIKEGTIN